MYNDRLLASFGIEVTTDDEEYKYLKFFKMITLSRQQRKPVLLILIEDPMDNIQLDVLISSLIEKDQGLNYMCCSQFNLIFM